MPRGRLKLWGRLDARGFEEGLCDGLAHEEHCKHKIYPASGLSREIKPLLQHLAYSVYFLHIYVSYKCSMS